MAMTKPLADEGPDLRAEKILCKCPNCGVYHTSLITDTMGRYSSWTGGNVTPRIRCKKCVDTERSTNDVYSQRLFKPSGTKPLPLTRVARGISREEWAMRSRQLSCMEHGVGI